MIGADVTLDLVKVLVVDDYQSIANGLCRQLRTRGHDARAVFSGGAALTEAATFEPHVVLLDMVLPDMTGYEVAKQLRLRSTAPLYIAGMSSRSMVPDENFDEQTSKPFGLARLAEILRAASKRPRGP